MNRTPLWRDRRLASLVVLCVILAFSAFLIADTVINLRNEAAAIAELERRTGLIEARAAELSARTAPGSADEPFAGVRLLVEGDTPGLVAAEFQRLFTEAVESAGATVRAIDAPRMEAMDDIRDESGGLLTRMRLEADVEVMEQSLPDLLLAIETTLPVLVIDALTLRANRRVDTVAGDAWVSAADRPLTLRFAVSAFSVGMARR